ncbi:MAG: citramalate synthase [Clostridiales bacterium]|nr:citramalate synthase [Clostridiales bacterium]
MKIKIFDSTLRDGAQGEGISFSVDDKIKIVKALDNLEIDYIESGNPGSNEKDRVFFQKIANIPLKYSKITAFGSTRRKNIKVEDDDNVMALLSANTSVVTIFGKSWDFHVKDIIRTTLEENLSMIFETIKYFKMMNKEVIFDAEHFFDGYKSDSEYALKTLEYAEKAGADTIVLCDTNGGAFPDEIADIVEEISKKIKIELGIHAHNDLGMAVANSILAVKKGVRHVQGTFTGFGERCGNANLSSIIPSLQLKQGYECIPKENLKKFTQTARVINEISNIPLSNNLPFVGGSAFSHKGGMHIDGVSKATHSFEHISPQLVGNKRRFLMSEMSGKSSILEMIQKVDPSIEKSSKKAQKILDQLKELEYQGYQYESAESSFELEIRKLLGVYKPFFKIEYFKTIIETLDSKFNSSCIIKVSVDGKEEFTAAEGNGPVNAIDLALRKSLQKFYPNLSNVFLTDYKVRVLNGENSTAAKVRVLIESSNGKEAWSTVGVSTDIIEASLKALVDSVEFVLLKEAK